MLLASLTSNYSHIPNYKIIRLFLVCSFTFAALYGVLHIYYPPFKLILFKMASILLLIASISLLDLKDKVLSNLLILALSFHCIGDIAIESFTNILFCIPFFLLGHLVYSIIFIRDIRLNCIEFKTWQYILALTFVLLTLANLYLFISHLSGVLTYGVFIYILILSLAGISSIFHPMFLRYLGFGIISYVTSDFIIGYSEFISPLAFRDIFSWPLYYFAQIAISASLIRYNFNKLKYS